MAKRDVSEEFRNDVLVDLRPDQVRRFGVAGKMPKPSRASARQAGRV